MSIFKEHKTSADRSATDRRRHKQKIEKAIREGIHDIVASESIIGKDGKKKIRIPVKGIKEYRFIYGQNENNKRAGSAGNKKDIYRGQSLGDKKKKPGKGKKAGSEPGVEYYDVEITLEELGRYLFDDLQLPELEKKQIKNLLGEKFKRHGYRNEGIRPRLDKKETLKKKLRRKAISKRLGKYDEEEERFTFHKDDLRYRHIKKDTRQASNAVIFFIMDISGSMTKEKKYLARSFFFLLYHFIRHRYENTELVFIAHEVEAREVSEDQFFHKASVGGTIVSSGLQKALEIISTRYHPNSWNIYAFHCSDGDNWPKDTGKAVELTVELMNKCQLYGYCETVPDEEKITWMSDDKEEKSELAQVYQHLVCNKFKMVYLTHKDDIWPAFKRFFGGVNV